MYGEKIRRIRQMRGLSQENIATRIGVAPNTFSKIETDQAKLESGMLLKIANALEVSPIDIVSNQLTIINSRKMIIPPFGNVETIISLQRDFFEKIIGAKDEEIANLNKIVDCLISRITLELR
ncbi:helix-turn-helix transcriptional regulator [Mucilaginibacter sp.]|uniref:helix-turn-helix domain-containing protein n=1 Tax=Mucilaginibacter sp. TaxID=1882438 RepID=UPI002613D249|nr:helix-turn-helix transcriptional regulator [Mucilaginibacter sp.]MDB4922157.1 helix-turn-helix domain protein [Mucilaginibacter sp.]